MQIWKWQKSGLTHIDAPGIHVNKPTVIICGGSFNVDNPAQALAHETALVKDFFDFIMEHIAADREVFKSLICGSLSGKLQLNYFSVQKLLGFISAVPGHPLYPETLAPSPPESIDIMEISYTDTHSCIDSIYKTYDCGEYYSQDARHFAEKLFLPPLTRHGRDIEAIAMQFSFITLFGISYGSNFIIEVENALVAMLVRQGYTGQEQHRLLSHVYAVAVSNMAHVRAAKGPRFTAVYFEGINDKLAAWMNPHKVPVPEGIAFSVVPLAEHRLLLLLPVTVTAERWIEVLPEFDYFWLDNDKAAHYTPFYTMRCLPENLLPECVERALRNAVLRSENPFRGVRDLLRSAPALTPMVHPCPLQVAKVNELIASAGYG